MSDREMLIIFVLLDDENPARNMPEKHKLI